MFGLRRHHNRVVCAWVYAVSFEVNKLFVLVYQSCIHTNRYNYFAILVLISTINSLSRRDAPSQIHT